MAYPRAAFKGAIKMTHEDIKRAREIITSGDPLKHIKGHYCPECTEFICQARTGWPATLDECERLQLHNEVLTSANQRLDHEQAKLRAENERLEDIGLSRIKEIAQLIAIAEEAKIFTDRFVFNSGCPECNRNFELQGTLEEAIEAWRGHA